MRTFIPTYRKSLVGLGLLAALSTGAYAVAQPAPPPPGPSARLVEDGATLRQEHRDRRAAMRERFEEGREARFEGHIAYLKTRLGITEAQTPLWENFVETLRNNMQERVEARPEPREADAAPPSLLDRLEREQSRIAARAEHLNATSEALAPLYNSFDDQQKATADRILRRIGENRMAMRDNGPRRGARPGPGGPRGGGRFGHRGFGGPEFGGPGFGRPDFDDLPPEGPEAGGPPQQL